MSFTLAVLALFASGSFADQEIVLRDVEGKSHTMTVPPKGHTLSAVIFVTVDCPISNAYAPEINRLVAAYDPKGVQFYLVHVDPDLSSSRAKAHAKEFGFKCPVLLDPRHQFVKELGATKTPEAFVLDRKGPELYRGRIDDRWADLGVLRDPRTHDLRDAIDAALAGKAVKVKRTEAVGCFIPKVS
ncbi:MAG: redoxin family protein [Fimbriimonadaceae bacterium]|nr:redoxin family protein [Fimbriimonadaceae bacterium]